MNLKDKKGRIFRCRAETSDAKQCKNPATFGSKKDGYFCDAHTFVYKRSNHAERVRV